MCKSSVTFKQMIKHKHILIEGILQNQKNLLSQEIHVKLLVSNKNYSKILIYFELNYFLLNGSHIPHLICSNEMKENT